MAKNRKTANIPQLPDLSDLDIDKLLASDQPELWDIQDPGDQMFWEEFFRVEEMLSLTDELDPPRFSITIQNHQTGEVKTYKNISLRSVRKKVQC
jgi:hypothetical protein